MTQEQQEAEAVEVAPMPLANAAATAELDQQILTARAFPRSVKRFLDSAQEMATLNESTASECMYVLPRGGKDIEGPSIRMAELVVSAWGNSKAGARVVDEGPEFVTAQGVFHDLERNVMITMEVRRRITDKYGNRFNADMIAVTGNAACAVAVRNAIFKGVPKALWQQVYEEARLCAIGTTETLNARRGSAVDYLRKMGVTPERICAKLCVEGIEDITLDQLGKLKGLAGSIKNGETTPEEAFPEIVEEESAETNPAAKGAAGLKDRASSAQETKE